MLKKSLRNLSGPTSNRVQASALQAYRIFIGRHPRWQDSFFDEHFVQTRVIPLLQKNTGPPIEQYAACLAWYWASQFQPAGEIREKTIAAMEPIMNEYLSLFNLSTGELQ